MAKNVVTPAIISRLTVVPLSLSLKNLSIISFFHIKNKLLILTYSNGCDTDFQERIRELPYFSD
jgi:hypothetical protein